MNAAGHSLLEAADRADQLPAGALSDAAVATVAMQARAVILRGHEATPIKAFPPTEADQIAALASYAGGSTLRYSPGRGRLVYQAESGVWLPNLAEVAWHAAAAKAAQLRGDLIGVPDSRVAERFYRDSNSGRGIRSVLLGLESDQAVFTPDEFFDKEPWLLNAAGLAVDLRNGSRRPARPTDLFTRTTGVKPAVAQTPVYDEFLKEITLGRSDLADWLEAFFGYALTGETSLHIFPNFWGLGRNGKGALVRLLKYIFGTYACTVSPSVLVDDAAAAGPRPDLVDLDGPRLGIAEELPSGKLAASTVKQISGGDRLRAARKYRDPYEFQPRVKLVTVSNNRLQLVKIDEAIRSRFILVPFEYRVEPGREDPALEDRLRDEAPAILERLIERAGLYYALGQGPKAMPPCKTITEASQNYIDDEDSVGRWLSERTNPFGTSKAAVLYQDFAAWTEQEGAHPVSSRGFNEALVAKSFLKLRGAAGRQFVGISLKAGDR